MKIHIKKMLAIMVINISIFTMGCSSEINVSINDIESNLIKNIDTESMEKGNQKTLRRFYGINPDDLEDFVLYTPKSNMDVDEMLVLKAKDLEKVDFIEESIESRVNRQIENFNGYGVDQVGLLDNYEMKIEDKYVFFVVSNKAEEIKEEFIKSIKNK
ncbi:DUF4358 domain-containing protein [Clostridium sp. CCUG 7971]|uniref:DUF4358 domain-containing protein n=1 Tax=Clostridium sp. CCUG 7971 TaxID=2811414 RepID=UPI001ABA41E9|nr:DUF4358 domain-containing protein [Clostridium sp. CCUG 7971]MBO3445786.1 DUF4358 domain-containing protein [Clostridium sp. CCUG 7971]